jgi:hypothetical protein
VEVGVIELIGGRLLTQIEIDEGSPVVLISEAIVAANNLQIGSVFDFHGTTWDYSNARKRLQNPWYETYLHDSFEERTIPIFSS